MTEKRQQTIDFELMSGIIERAERMGIARNRTTHFLDLSNAHKAFNLDLEAFLHGNIPDFVHDFTGIWANIDRTSGKFEENFLPRFAKQEVD